MENVIVDYSQIIDFVGIERLKYILCFLLLSLLVSIVLFIVCGYCLIKLLKWNIDDSNILFYNYTNKSKKVLELYGDHEIKNIYLVRKPLSNYVTFILNIISFYNYKKLINTSKCVEPYHLSFIFELNNKTSTLNKKFILVEKNNTINISENIHINEKNVITQIKPKSKYTLKNILDETQERIGNKTFFNWHCYKNNCKLFTKEILKTIKKYSKENRQFIYSDISSCELKKTIIPTDFTKHIINSVVNIANIIEKYLNI